jgi:hypothetical protein
MTCPCPCSKRTTSPLSTTRRLLPLRHRVPTRLIPAPVKTPFLASLSGFQCSSMKGELPSLFSRRWFHVPVIDEPVSAAPCHASGRGDRAPVHPSYTHSKCPRPRLMAWTIQRLSDWANELGRGLASHCGSGLWCSLRE